MLTLQNKNKEKGEIYNMFKKVTIATAFSAALLFGGSVQSVDASATYNPSQSEGNVSQHDSASDFGNRDIYIQTLQDFLDYFCQDDNGNWHSSENQKTNNPSNTNGEENEKSQQEVDTDESQENANDQSNQAEESQNNTEQQSNQAKEQNEDSDSGQLNAFEQEVVTLTNQEREKNGLDPLKVDAELSVVARDKSQDMSSNGYFSHTSPTYGSPFDMMESYGISYRTAGENIARGQQSPSEVVNGWMNSEGHRENILNPNFTHIGVGYVEQGNYWTQEFTGN